MGVARLSGAIPWEAVEHSGPEDCLCNKSQSCAAQQGTAVKDTGSAGSNSGFESRLQPPSCVVLGRACNFFPQPPSACAWARRCC